MTLVELKGLLLTADPKIKRYRSTETGNYTIWRDYNEIFIKADDQIRGSLIYVQIDRYTKDENDPIVDAITQALDAGGVPLINRRTVFEADNEYRNTLYEADSGYIHHIWDLVIVNMRVI